MGNRLFTYKTGLGAVKDLCAPRSHKEYMSMLLETLTEKPSQHLLLIHSDSVTIPAI